MKTMLSIVPYYPTSIYTLFNHISFLQKASNWFQLCLSSMKYSIWFNISRLIVLKAALLNSQLKHICFIDSLWIPYNVHRLSVWILFSYSLTLIGMIPLSISTCNTLSLEQPLLTISFFIRYPFGPFLSLLFLIPCVSHNRQI